MEEGAIQISNLGKKYYLNRVGATSFRESVSQKINQIFNSRNEEEFWALRDINISVKQGESIGVIGRNGAGKSTLLKLISRITEPSEGRIVLNGRISSLLEVGTGFHPELTGRENIFLNGVILGMTRGELKNKLDEIIEFSGVDKFIDTPVKHYSSGMKVRLAFSVAAHLEPEILLIDEVLAVGDAEFQRKCLGKMEDATNQGRTVLFVSHNLGAIQSFCTQTIFLENGKMKFFGETSTAIDAYLKLGEKSADLATMTQRDGDGRLHFEKVEFIHEEKSTGSIFSGMNLNIRVHYKASGNFRNVIIRLQVISHDGYILFTCNNFHSSTVFEVSEGLGYFNCEIPDLPLNSGDYYLNLHCLIDRELADELEHISPFHVEPGNFYPGGKLPSVKQGVLIKHNWSVHV